MLVLRRKEGQWIDVTHKSGDVIRIRVYQIEGGAPGRLNLAFDDDERNYEIERPERKHKFAKPEEKEHPTLGTSSWEEWAKGEDAKVEAEDPAMSTVRYLQGISPDRLKKRIG